MINRFKEWISENTPIILIGIFFALAILSLISLLMRNDDSVRILHYARVTNINNESIVIEHRAFGIASYFVGCGYNEKEIPVDNSSEYEIGDILAFETNRSNEFLAILDNILYDVYGTVTDVGYNGITVTYADGGYGEEETEKKLSVDDPSQYEVGDILTIKVTVIDDILTVSKDEKVIWTNWLLL